MGLSADYRFPLSFYFRVANQLVKQAKVYRDEGNVGDLYLTLTRYSRLVSEIIPQHQSYSNHSSKEKLHHKKILEEFAKEIDKLKPRFGTKDNEINGQSPMWPEQHDDPYLTYQTWNEKSQVFANYDKAKANPRSTIRTEGRNVEPGATKENTVSPYRLVAVDKRNIRTLFESPFSVALTGASNHDNVHAVKQFFPSPILSCGEHPPRVGHISHITVPESRNEYLESSCGETSSSKDIQDVHLSAKLMEEFMELARTNTDKNMETCGILGAFLTNQTFYVTTLIVPKQESTSYSCQALNEEEIYAIQDDLSLFPIGWIHTHPSQTCFLSSIDLHTQYSYQVMLPEAVAIVMAPTDPTRGYGIFRLTDPGGMAVLRQCQEKGFHPHQETADGSPIFESCSKVYINPNLRLEIIDLRTSSP